MKILSLRLRNFKGLSAFEMHPDGKNAQISGKNGTGKTTICDAVYWLLTDKNSHLKKQFMIKTLDDSGESAHGLEHEAEGVFRIETGEKITLKKIYTEKWTKKRGSVKDEMTGHTTDHFIDGVPVSKTEYQTRLTDFIDEESFKLLTVPVYFSEVLPWKKRRDLLMKICGDIPDDKIKETENRKKVIAARQTKINEEIKKIPVRIDELNRQMQEIADIDKKYENAVITTLKTAIPELEQKAREIESCGVRPGKIKRLLDIDAELTAIENKATQAHKDDITACMCLLKTLKTEFDTYEANRQSVFEDAKRTRQQAEKIKLETETLRADWYKIKNEKFICNQSQDKCPACGQDIPEEIRKTALEQAQAEFNLLKSKKLTAINDKGADLRIRHESLIADYKYKNDQLESIINKMHDLQTRIDPLNEKLTQLMQTHPDFNENATHQKLINERAALKNEIENLENDETESELLRIQAEINTCNQRMDAARSNILKVESADKLKIRIAELMTQEKQFAAEYEKLAKELFDIESEIVTAVNAIESDINRHFRLARFKLYNEQINGGIEPICTVTHNGIAFDTDLNDGAKIEVGLDIIRTLQAYYGKKPFIMIDNNESITTDHNIDAQLICFNASRKHDHLTVEYTER